RDDAEARAGDVQRVGPRWVSESVLARRARLAALAAGARARRADVRVSDARAHARAQVGNALAHWDTRYDRPVKIALVEHHAEPENGGKFALGVAAVDESAPRGGHVVGFADLACDRSLPRRPAGSDRWKLCDASAGPPAHAFAYRARRHAVVIVRKLYER